jgi:outer membrane usher protein
MRSAPCTAVAFCVALLALFCSTAVRADDDANLDGGWREAVLAVNVNGLISAQDVIALRDPSDALWLADSDFARLRLHLPKATQHVSNGRRYFPVSALSGARVQFDDAHSAVSITVQPETFEGSNLLLSGGGPRPPLTSSSTGAFLNYQLFGQTGNYGGAGLFSAYSELGIFSPAGLLDNTALETLQHGTDRFERLSTTFSHDFSDALETLRLGDAISVPGSWAEAVRFAGLQFGTNYGIRPDLVTTPLLAATGTAVVPSTVDVFVNGRPLGSTEVPAGPFVINQVPAMTGAGDVSIVVRNAAGQEQVMNVPFYSAAVMLQPGLSTWDVDIGPVRENYGIESDDYGRLMAAATWRHGFTSTLTGEVHAEALHDGPQAAGIDIAQQLGHWAVVTLDLAAGGQSANSGVQGGPAQPASSGSYGALGIQHVDGRFSFVLQGELASSGFRDVGDYGSFGLTPRDRSIAQASWNMGARGSILVAYVDQINFNDTRQNNLGVTYQISLGRATLSANLSRTTGETSDTNVSVFFILPLDGRHTATTQFRYDNTLPSPNGALVQTLQKSLPLGPGDGYLLSAGTDGSYQAQYTRQMDDITLEAQAARYAGASAENLTASGALVLMDGDVHAARTISDSFATVEVGGIPGMTVYQDNQPIATTDANGVALVPYLRSFDVNRLSVDPLQLPLDASVNNPQVAVVPPYRSGILVRFPVKREHSGVFKLRQADGTVVPSGAVVKFQGDEFPVGLDGLAYVTGYDHGTSGVVLWNGGQCSFRLPPPPANDPQPDLGTIDCRNSP